MQICFANTLLPPSPKKSKIKARYVPLLETDIGDQRKEMKRGIYRITV